MVIISARYLWDVSCPSNFAEETPSTPTQINSHFLSIRGIMSICVTLAHVSHGSPRQKGKVPLLCISRKMSFQTNSLLGVFICGAGSAARKWPQERVERLQSHPLTAMMPHTMIAAYNLSSWQHWNSSDNFDFVLLLTNQKVCLFFKRDHFVAFKILRGSE